MAALVGVEAWDEIAASASRGRGPGVLLVAGMARSYSAAAVLSETAFCVDAFHGVGARHARDSALGICPSRYRGHGPLVPGNMAFWGPLCNQSSDSGCVPSR